MKGKFKALKTKKPPKRICWSIETVTREGWIHIAFWREDDPNEKCYGAIPGTAEECVRAEVTQVTGIVRMELVRL